MKVVNLFGGPGVGKSILSAKLFGMMKEGGINVELVGEYAKDMVYEKRDNMLADQLYILAKQNRRLARLKECGVEWAVTDGAILNGLVYAKDAPKPLLEMISECHNQYDNYNVLLQRNPRFEYQPEGRTQKTVEEALIKDREIEDMLREGGVEYIPYRVGWDSEGTLLYEIQRLEGLGTVAGGTWIGP